MFTYHDNELNKFFFYFCVIKKVKLSSLKIKIFIFDYYDFNWCVFGQCAKVNIYEKRIKLLKKIKNNNLWWQKNGVYTNSIPYIIIHLSFILKKTLVL